MDKHDLILNSGSHNSESGTRDGVGIGRNRKSMGEGLTLAIHEWKEASSVQSESFQGLLDFFKMYGSINLAVPLMVSPPPGRMLVLDEIAAQLTQKYLQALPRPEPNTE
ncbi:MAG: hypothetical protein WCA35_22590 [Kovacikia sp.]